MRAPERIQAAGGAARVRLKARAVGQEDRPPELNMTSMTDVIFILLIFFISLSEIRASQVDLDLPSVDQSQEQKADEREPEVVEITAKGQVLFAGQPREVSEIVGALVELRRRTGAEPRVRIRGDRTGQFGVFAKVLAALSGAELRRIEIEVQAGHGQ